MKRRKPAKPWTLWVVCCADGTPHFWAAERAGADAAGLIEKIPPQDNACAPHRVVRYVQAPVSR